MLSVALLIGASDAAWAKKKNVEVEQPQEPAQPNLDDPAVAGMYHQRIVDVYGSYDNNGLAAYVQKVGEQLAAQTEGVAFDWHFTILDMETVNAFATPGGYVYITRAMLALLNSEAQLAAVLGHEIGHITGHHAQRQQTAANVIANVSEQMAKLDDSKSFNLGDLFGAGLVRGYGRDMELEADETGAKMIGAAGYDPHAMLEVVDLLKAIGDYQRTKSDEEPVGRYHAMLATHPDEERRRRELVEAASTDLTGRRDAGRDEFLDHLDGIAWSGSRAQGVVRGNQFLHHGLDFALTFPEGWIIYNLPDKIVAVSPDDNGMMQVSMADRTTRKLKKVPVEQFLQKFLGMSKWQSARQTEVHGLDAFIATVPQLKSPHGIRTGRAGVVFDGPTAFIFFGTTKDADRQRRYDRQFDSVIESTRKLDAADRVLAEPLAVHIVEMKPGASLSDYTPIEGIDDSVGLLRLLNGLYPDGEPAPGDRAKIIR